MVLRRRLVTWLALAALYLLLVWTLVPAEFVMAALAATIGTTGVHLVGRRRRARLRLRWDLLRGARRPLIGMFADVVPLARVLLARGSGRFEEVPFAGAEDATRRAFAEALGSLAPGTFVVDVDRERGVLLTHRLAP